MACGIYHMLYVMQMLKKGELFANEQTNIKRTCNALLLVVELSGGIIAN